jgi:hypothetical protein
MCCLLCDSEGDGDDGPGEEGSTPKKKIKKGDGDEAEAKKVVLQLYHYFVY